MVVLTVTALTPRGAGALRAYCDAPRSMKERVLKIGCSVVSEEPFTIKITYQRKLNAVVVRDPQLAGFAVSRGKQMAAELAELYGAPRDEVSAEVSFDE